MAEYEAVLFDNDGIIVEPTDRGVLRGAIRETYADYGVEPSTEEVEELMGVTIDVLEGIANEYGLDPAEFWYRRDMNASKAQCELIREGGKPLYDDADALSELSVDLGVVSNNQHRTIEHILEFYELEGLFETHYGREPTLEGIERKKPSAYYLERALSDLDTRDALYVGDSGVDVLAATEADVDCAFVRRPHREGYELPAAPTYEVESLADLHAILRGDGGAFRPDMEPAT
jgi:phosphoglycolate phosphatase